MKIKKKHLLEILKCKNIDVNYVHVSDLPDNDIVCDGFLIKRPLK